MEPKDFMAFFFGRRIMTNEELNTKLYEKLFAEQERYRDWLLTQPASEVLHHCYQYTIREDIILALEYMALSDAQCKALLESRSPLDDIFLDFEKLETDHMQTIRDAIEARADKLLRENARDGR